jgi:hypothetical protein
MAGFPFLLKWLPWRFIIRRAARSQGILDPILLLTRLARFGKLGDIGTPGDLLRSGVVLHARGLINNQAIQHNLDWVWPYWVRRQFDPRDVSFVPRAFSLTHINLTHRNWTAVGLPTGGQTPIVDPAGLVTPFFDGWSVDAWMVYASNSDRNQDLIPSRCREVSQRMDWSRGLAVRTASRSRGGSTLYSTARVELEGNQPVCVIDLEASAEEAGNREAPGTPAAWLAVSFRPCNPEGVSFIHRIAVQEGGQQWVVNGSRTARFSEIPNRFSLSEYAEGDVYNRMFEGDGYPVRRRIACPVGMATGAALFRIPPGAVRRITLAIPEEGPDDAAAPAVIAEHSAADPWEESLSGACRLSTADRRTQYLYDAALRTLLLHSGEQVYAGPYTYRRFWIRDASLILQTLLCLNLVERAGGFIEELLDRQKPSGYFHSHNGEWDANGEVLWFLERFCRLSGRAPRNEWSRPVRKAADWIIAKRLPREGQEPHAGLLPPGFSAEHFGPNDYYYWDDFWAAAGLRAASFLAGRLGKKARADSYRNHSQDLLASIDRSLALVAKKFGREIMPVSPYRRLDSAAVGSLAAGYPLQLFEPQDRRLRSTAGYLLDHCLVGGGLFHDMSHSGINPYLTLHLAQVLLRAGDPRWLELMRAVADLASPTGQWPEAVHPRTGGGCMGDGQHVWAASEWLMMVRNCLLREEGEGLLVCPGIPDSWLSRGQALIFGPAPTSLGTVELRVEKKGRKARVRCGGEWFSRNPRVRVGPEARPLVLDEHGAGEALVELWRSS